MSNIKSPFKPLKFTNDPFLDFMKEEAEKGKEENNERIDLEKDVLRSISDNASDDFKPQLKEPKTPSPKIEKYTVHLQDKDIVIKQKDWSKFLAGLYMDIFNADVSLKDISVEIKNIMNRNGIDVNTNDIDLTIENTQERMLKIFIAKNMCYSLGMASEWQDILNRELDLVYPERPLLGSLNKNKA